MPKVTFVKSARKKNPVANVGESYYWWAFMQGGRGGPKRYSKERPKPSQLTQSDFWSAVYSLQESLSEPDFENLESSIDDVKGQLEEIRDNTQGKYDNLPEGFQQGTSGELLENRVNSVDEAISTIESIDLDFDDSDIEEVDEDVDPEDGETKKEAIERLTKEREAKIEEAKAEKASEAWGELVDAVEGISD